MSTQTLLFPPALWNGDPLRTRLLDALSLLLPAGEAFVIRAVTDWLDTQHHATEPASDTLRAQAQHFIDEERTHQRAHGLYNQRLAQQGLPALALAERMCQAAAQLNPLSLSTRLALGAAFEHLTVLLSHEVLKGQPWLSPDSDGPQAHLWRWHCAEEIGHRYVMLDLAAHHGVGTLRRVACLLLASLYLGGDVLGLLVTLLRHDLRHGHVRRGALALQTVRFTWAALPGLLRMAGGWLAYLGPMRRR
jgi:predicted metal-dependent hydrolase